MYTAVPFTGKTTTEVQFPPTVLRFFFINFFFFLQKLPARQTDRRVYGLK